MKIKTIGGGPAAALEPHVPAAKPGGRPRGADVREVVDAILSVLRNGIVWRALPRDFPPWKTVHHYFRIWRIDGTWEKLNAALRERLRVRAKRNIQPSAAIVDSQSVKTAEKGGAAGTTRGRKSAAESGISWSILWVYCSRSR